jgi:rRNA-processing protein FCF1
VLNDRADWPADIEQVYLDGNNMMFVVNSLRRLCLNRAGRKTERALGEIASAWNEHMHIPNIDLIFDATRQLDQVGCVRVASAQPKHRTTDDMLVELARRPDQHEKNKRTIIVTSDRALAALVSRKNSSLFRLCDRRTMNHSSCNAKDVSS